MELGLLAVIAIVLLVGTSIFGARIGIAAPLLLVVIGISIGYIPIVPDIRVDPEIILLGVLPPLLYAASVNTPLVDFRRNIQPIAGLSVVLVLLSALAIGGLLHLAVPTIPFPVAVALGAVVSPTDAVAATSIGKRLGMPERLVAILEGESLVNDATSLVLLKTALAAVAGGFAFWSAAGTFAFSVTAAIIIGYLIGIATVWVRSKLTNPVHDTVISFVVPFVAFLPAEEIGASGVLAVVVTGLYTGHHSASRFSATARMNERLNWRTLQFVIENGVFLIMGLELHTLVDAVSGNDLQLGHLPLIAIGVVVMLIAIRALFLVPLLFSMRRNLGRYQLRSAGFMKISRRLRDADDADPARVERVDRLAQRSRADLAHERDQRLGWRDGAVLSWSGMRGVVTLAAAQSIPTEVPLRPQLILIAFFVAVITLLLHGLTLPTVIKKLWPGGAGTDDDGLELASLSSDLIEAGNIALDDLLTNPPHDEADFAVPSDRVIERVRASSRGALAPLAVSLPETGAIAGVEEETPAQAYLRVARYVLDAQRDALLEERAIGRYSSSALRQAELALDVHETRLSGIH